MLVKQGWGARKQGLDAGFDNHGARVNFYKDMAGALGLPAHFGAMWANFGDPVETGVAGLQAGLAAVESDPAVLAEAQALLADAEGALVQAEAEVAQLTLDIAAAEGVLADPEATDAEQATAEATLAAAAATLIDAEVALGDAETAVTDAETVVAEAAGDPEAAAALDAELAAAIADAKPGNGPKGGWETVDLDLNGDGVVDDVDLEAALAADGGTQEADGIEVDAVVPGAGEPDA